METDELRACERLVVDHMEQAYRQFGAQRVAHKRGLTRRRRIVLALARLNSLCFLRLYLTTARARRKHVISLFRNRIVFSDHRNELIQKRVLGVYKGDVRDDVAVRCLRAPMLLFFGPQSMIDVVKSFRRTRPSAPTAVAALCDFWSYYTVYCYSLARHDFDAVLVVDDFTGRRLALVLAAKHAGLQVGIVKMSDESGRPCPFQSYDVLFCWNHQQSSEAEGSYKAVTHLCRPLNPMKRIAEDHDTKLSVGIAMNAYYSKEGLVEVLSRLHLNNRVQRILVRFHPHTRFVGYPTDLGNVDYEVSDNEPGAFFEGVHILICGNTSLIKEALVWGVPVAYEGALDSGQRNRCAYLRDGAIYDVTSRSLDTGVIREMNRFYRRQDWEKLRDQWTSHDPRAWPLRDALEGMFGKSGS